MNLPELFIYGNRIEEERFVPIRGFETRFWISDFGRLVSYDHRKNTVNFLKPHIDICGYYQAQLRMKPNNRKVRVHQLVAEHFCIRKNPLDIFVNHDNGIKLDNYYKNLEWVTPSENVKHAVRIGIFNIKGSKHPFAKLTEEKVLQIRKLYKTGLTQKEIGIRFGVSRRHAGEIINLKNWGWLTEPQPTEYMQA